MPKAISKNDMCKMTVRNQGQPVERLLSLMAISRMPANSYAIISQHVLLVDEGLVRCHVLVLDQDLNEHVYTMNVKVEDFDKLPEVDKVIAEMGKAGLLRQ